MEDMEGFTTGHMDALEDVLSEHSVISVCADVRVAMRLDMGHVSIAEIHSMEGRITLM